MDNKLIAWAADLFLPGSAADHVDSPGRRGSLKLSFLSSGDRDPGEHGFKIALPKHIKRLAKT